jgi:hypothetical protein
MLKSSLTRLILPTVLEATYNSLMSQKAFQIFGKDLPITLCLAASNWYELQSKGVEIVSGSEYLFC